MDTAKVLKYRCENLRELPSVIKRVFENSAGVRVWAFSGEMGAGKTTVIKELCNLAGVSDLVTSPTFTIVNEYQTINRDPVYHFDFYRIKSETEAYDLGFEQYLYSGNYCFIEWPEKIESLIPADAIKVMIKAEGEARDITMSI